MSRQMSMLAFGEEWRTQRLERRMSAIEGIFKVWESDKLRNGFSPLKVFANHKTKNREKNKTRKL